MTISTHQNQSAGCPICDVHITDNGKVQFANGNVGTRAQLYARVCKFARNQACINRDKTSIGAVMEVDGFTNEKQTSNNQVYWQLFRT